MLRSALLFMAVISAFAGPQVLTFHSDVDGSEQPYALYLPKSYDAAKRYPLVISLHGAGSNHRLNLRRVFGMGNLPLETDADAGRYFPPFRDVEFIVASPLARGTMGYQGIAEKDVYDVLAEVERRYSIDEDRVYLTGLSMGGGGALWLGLTRPDIWAAIAAVCPAVPPAAEGLEANAVNVPVHLFHGDEDPAVPVETSRRWHKLLLASGVRAEYVEYPGVRHNSWDYAYRNGAIFEWFGRFRRERHPDRVRFSTRAYEYNTAYWVQFDSLTPGTPASIDARFTARNRIEVTTSNLDGFTLHVGGHPRFAPAVAVALTIDGAVLRVKPLPDLSFHRNAKGWQTGPGLPPPGAKRRGAEGPIPAAIRERHIYVYGTADAPSAEELKERRGVAAQAAEWSSSGAHLMVSFAVKADREVSAEDIAGASLVLFGNRETNSLVARFADRFPIALNPGAADYGLVYLAALASGHYAIVNSGLPWWTGAAEAARPGLRNALPPFHVLETFPDFILFKGSLENVVAEGRFERDWTLPADAAAKMKATGALR